MLLTIYDKAGTKRADVAVNDSSTQSKEVQGDNVLSLSFSYYAFLPLDVNDYTDYLGERYWLTERYTPKQVNEGEWDYDLKLYGVESLIKRFLVLETTDGDTNPLFTLTATPREHVAMVVKAINDGMGHITDWKVGTVEGTELITIDYEGIYCDEALKAIAQKAGGKVEWWIEGQTVNVCRCEHGEEITLGYGKGLTSLERDTGNTDKFYTRLFPVGSTRNIDPEKYGSPRLMLPGRKRCVEVGVDKYGIYDHYEEKAFSGIYPHRTGTVSNVRKEDVKDDDGNPFTIYYFSDSSLNFDPNSYELPEETKRVSFQDGDLSGLGQGDDHFFEVSYDSKTREFEIITIWPYDDDTQLPGGNLIPKEGDHYILWNIRMPDEYYPMAEEEFQKAVDEYNKEHWRDISVYKAPTDHVWMEENRASLYVGRRVKLESRTFFPETGYRSSRITKITRKVNLPGEMDIEISDALQSGVLDRVNASIGELKNYTKSRTEGASLPDIIRSWDNTIPTDNNIFSARRSLKESLSKRHPDTASELIGFLKGVTFGQCKPGESGGFVDGDANAEYLTAVIRELLRSTSFVDGMFGEGWQIWIDRLTGLSNLTIDKITVRQALVALELLIEKVRSVGGQLVVSAANGKVKTVTKDGDNYRITFEQENQFVAHDLLRCATYTGTSLVGYWVEVLDGDRDGVIVPVREYGGTEPKEGDECVLMGNTENSLRQNLISIAATEDGQPRIDVLDGVNSKNFNGCLRCRFGNLDGIKDSAFPPDKQPHGNGMYGDNVFLRGTFILMTGEDILTRFEVTEGKIHTAVEGLRNEVREEQSYFDNTTFAAGMSKWTSGYKAAFLTFGGKWIWANGGPLSSNEDGNVEVLRNGTIPYVRIQNSYILQVNKDFRTIPDFKEVNADGLRIPGVVYLSFHYRVLEAGRLHIEFVNADKAGFENFNIFSYDGDFTAGGEKVFNHSGLWNGTGDFKLSFTGVIQISLLVFSTDRADALAYKYATFFEQSDKLVRIAAANFDKDGNVLESSSIITTAKYNKLISRHFNEDGTLKNVAGLVTTTDFNSAMDGIQDQFGDYVKITSFAGMFAKAVSDDGNIVKQADISVFITEDQAGELISHAQIRADQINLKGAVTFESLNSSLQGTINGKANISSLGDMAYEDAVEAARLGSTIIDGGYLNTNYIKVNRIDADGAKVGGFTIDNGRLHWVARDYFGGDSRSLKLGVSQTDTEGVVDVAFNAATQGRFGIKAVGSNLGGAAIYASTGTLTYPAFGTTYAGFFVGGVSVRGNFDSDNCASTEFRYITGRNSDGSYTYNAGVNWGNGASQNPDLDKIRLIVRGGIIVGYTGE